MRCELHDHCLIISFHLAIVINDTTARIFLGSLLALMVVAAVFYWKKQRCAELTLNAEGVSHTSWQRPLGFRDVEKITGRRQYSTVILTFQLKTKQPPFQKSTLLRFSTKKVSLALSGGLQDKPMVIADMIFKYFKRQTVS